MANLTLEDRQILKSLAEQYARVAGDPEQAARRLRWEKLNGLCMERPMVLIDQLPWGEMDVDGALTARVSDPYWRGVESWLRQTLYKWAHLRCDMVVLPWVLLPRPITISGWGIEAQIDRRQLDAASGVFSQHMHNQILSEADVEKIKTPRVSLDERAEADIVETAGELFDGIAPFRLCGQVPHLGLWDTVSFWMGVENCYIELIDRPQMIHAVMEKLTRGWLSIIEQMNALELMDVASNLCHCSHTFEAGVQDGRPAISQNAWAFGMAQLFTSVAPAVTAEFEVPYMRRLFPHFHAIYYGCCDRLDDRLEIIERMPNIRKISCSPWSDRHRFAANLPARYVMSNKPSPAFLAFDSFDERLVRQDLRETMDAAKAHGLNLELILKDISTVRHDPKRLWRWAEIAMEEAQR